MNLAEQADYKCARDVIPENVLSIVGVPAVQPGSRSFPLAPLTVSTTSATTSSRYSFPVRFACTLSLFVMCILRVHNLASGLFL